MSCRTVETGYVERSKHLRQSSRRIKPGEGKMSSKFICFEALESRRLMSASAMALAMADHAEMASKVHLTVPQISGAVFHGTATSKDGAVPITFTVITEAKTGKLTGTLLVAHGGDNGADLVFAVKGSINVHGVFTLT